MNVIQRRAHTMAITAYVAIAPIREIARIRRTNTMLYSGIALLVCMYVMAGVIVYVLNR